MENQEFFVDEILQTAIFLGKPDGQKQSHRALFQSWMPDLYLLRARGFSWMQLAELLAKAEINLRPCTVKSYYYAALPECEVLCREKSADQLLLLKEIREKARAATMKSLIERISPAPAVAPAPAVMAPPVAPVPAVVPVAPAPAVVPKLRCLPVKPGNRELVKVKEIPDFVYQPGDLEHPAVPGVMLSLEQRMTCADLQFINDATGEIRPEDDRHEKRFRILWRVPIRETFSRSHGDFVVMNESLFKNRHVENQSR